MTPAFYRALLVGTALALIPFQAQSQAQIEDETAAETDATMVGDGATLLPRLDVGAGAENSAGVPVIAVTREDLERLQPSDIQEVFAGEPGVAVGGAIASTQKIYINGVDETNLAVTVDGSRQNNKVFHHNGTYLLDPALLKAVTVQPAVAPADAGPAALSGSIGFETVDVADLLEPDRTFGGFGSLTYDTNSQTFITGGSLYAMHEGFEVLGFINYANGDNYTAGNGQEMLGSSANLLSGLGKVAYESLDGHRFELSHEQIRDDAPRPYRANFYFNNAGRGEPVVRDYTFDRRNTVFTYTTTAPIGWYDPKIILAFSESAIEVPYYFGTYLGQVIGTTASFNGKAENRFNFDLGSVTAGFDFYSDVADLEDGSSDPATLTEERAQNLGGYVQARLEPTDRARLSFGGRVDNQWFEGVDGSRSTNAGVSGNFSGEYDVLPDLLTLKAGASHVWGGIPLAENYIQNQAWTYGAGPEPVVSDNVIVGFEAYAGNFTFEGNLFRNIIENARFPAFSPAIGPNRSFDLDSWGWDIGARYDWDNAFVSTKYSQVHAEVDGAYADTDVGRYITTPIGQIIMVSAGYTFVEWGLTVGGDAEFAFENDDTATEHPFSEGYDKLPLPAYQVVNLFAEYKPAAYDNLTLRVEARNIFDETYTSRASYGQDFDGTIPHLEPGRSFRLNARMKF